MSNQDYMALKAKVKMANCYIDQVMQKRGKFDLYDIFKVVTPSMRPMVEIATLEQAMSDGLGIVRIRTEVA